MGGRQPLLPDRDLITTKAWTEAYKLSMRPPPGDGEEDERVLWPRGMGAYYHSFGRSLAISDRAPSPATGSYEYGGLGMSRKEIDCNRLPLSWDFLE